jgi:hypothetical protein
MAAKAWRPYILPQNGLQIIGTNTLQPGKGLQRAYLMKLPVPPDAQGS